MLRKKRNDEREKKKGGMRLFMTAYLGRIRLSNETLYIHI
jgi:hypothetical protein